MGLHEPATSPPSLGKDNFPWRPMILLGIKPINTEPLISSWLLLPSNLWSGRIFS